MSSLSRRMGTTEEEEHLTTTPKYLEEEVVTEEVAECIAIKEDEEVTA